MNYTTTFEWTETDSRYLAKLQKILVPQAESALDEFYDWVMTKGPGPSFLTPDTIDRVKALQLRFWIDFFDSPPSPAYAASRSIVGIQHAEIGLNSQLFLASMRKFQQIFERLLSQRIRSPRTLKSLIQAMAKKIDIDIAIIIDAYTNHYTEIETKRTSFRAKLVSLLNELTQGNFNIQIPEASAADDKPFADALQQLTNTLRNITHQTHEISQGRYELASGTAQPDNFLGQALRDLASALKQTAEANEDHTWKLTGLNRLSTILRGDSTTEVIASSAAQFLGRYIGVPIVSIYTIDSEKDEYILMGQHGNIEGYRRSVPFGTGYIGQCGASMETISVDGIPEESLSIQTGIGTLKPQSLFVAPLRSSTRSVGVIEIGSFTPLTIQTRDLLEISGLAIASALESSIARASAAHLLKSSVSLTTKLEAQHDALSTANQELESRTEQLEKTEIRLRRQQDALRETNSLLQKSNSDLKATEALAKNRNSELEIARLQIEEKADDLERASQYKSDFLANMSHELRTPLNSVLLLSGHLAANKAGRLDSSEVESAEVIYSSGKDLLSLINEVLDLAKIESGHLEIQDIKVDLRSLAKRLELNFRAQAEQKNIVMRTQFAVDVPAELVTDGKRVEQILKNLLSNALKFTKSGSVVVEFALLEPQDKESLPSARQDPVIQIKVTDTGIGIASAHREHIFEAFQQAETGTSRRYGGTGLGLSISKQLTQLLGGTLELLESSSQGSTFALSLPIEPIASSQRRPSNPTNRAATLRRVDTPSVHNPIDLAETTAVDDDRGDITASDQLILLIEDDRNFADFTRDLCRQSGFKCLIATTGEEGIALAKTFRPAGILLDINLPGMDGWAVLADLKNDIRTRHIPVQFASIDERQAEAFQRGAIGYVSKPASVSQLTSCLEHIAEYHQTSSRTLLIAHEDPGTRAKIRQTLELKDIHLLETDSSKGLYEIATQKSPDCIVIGTRLSDGASHEAIGELAKDGAPLPPIIFFNDGDLDELDLDGFAAYATDNIVHSVRSSERLLDEVALIFHCVFEDLPDRQQEIISRIRSSNDCHKGRKLLLVEDDMRSAFALSEILIQRGMEVHIAENGQLGLDQLQKIDFDLILTDITMPLMDGYQMIAKIREQKEHRNLPILTLTANAMKEERSKSIRAGANDYLTKPIDIEQLCSAMRVWLYR